MLDMSRWVQKCSFLLNFFGRENQAFSFAIGMSDQLSEAMKRISIEMMAKTSSRIHC